MNTTSFDQLIKFGALQQDEAGYELPFSINPLHEIFKGHFPQQPVLPGVATMEILRRALELATAKRMQLKQAANIKFLGMVDPVATPDLTLSFNIAETDEGLKVRASIKVTGSEDVLYKQQATFHAD
ncbi:hypothetical protein N6H18_10460 [Reichenbachiella agarivorans]|uniref:ApeI dehydratase-like domain-containing protein n=1 Tax=Reichenbachiella agarivorans TaxID=2979464 RepID=A0ABY6CJS5_9BACT|nr:hypothetical protein [Reichenbachiella agarivorans]UXP30774.1 hypothetical protein N6H18_10460 [Reichenbachiella agarivorans]